MPGSEPHRPVHAVRAPASNGATVQLVRWHGERARLELNVDRSGTPVTTIHPADARPLSGRFVGHCTDLLASVGGSVMSPALGIDEVRGFEAAGFATRADLHLLVHDLRPVPVRPRVDDAGARRGSRGDAACVLVVDAAAFPEMWHLDERGFHNALRATPSARFRVMVDARNGVVGYAITGRAGRRGYLQRLAVTPQAQGRGVGRHLVADGLSWCRRWRVQRVAVNTQHGNSRALELYLGMGFVEAPTGLRVLERVLPVPATIALDEG